MKPTLTIHDCRKAGYCVKGCRRRCAELDLDFKLLCREGLPLDELEELGRADVQIRRSCEVARERIAAGGN